MGDLTRNYSRHENACNCGCGFDTIDMQMAIWRQQAHDLIEQALGEEIYGKVTSGCRCPKHNSSVNGSSRSTHLFGRASDLQYFVKSNRKQIPPKTVYDAFEIIMKGKGGLASYPTFTHMDSRSGSPWRQHF